MARTQPPSEGEPILPADDEPQPPGMPSGEPAPDDMSVQDLKAQAAARGIDTSALEGSGEDGRVVKADLIEALNEVPEPPAGRPPLIQVAEGAAVIPMPTEG